MIVPSQVDWQTRARLQQQETRDDDGEGDEDDGNGTPRLFGNISGSI